MLSQIDTVIGFVVVMSIVSLLIMVVTQMVSSFLGLRGKNLADALEVMFHQVHPEIDAAVCQHLANYVLTHPSISDSVLRARKAKEFQRWFPWIRRLRVRWLRASAIRSDELLDLLRRTARGSARELRDSLRAAELSVERTLAKQAPSSAPPPAPQLTPAPLASPPLQRTADAIRAARSALDAAVKSADYPAIGVALEGAVEALSDARAKLPHCRVARAKWSEVTTAILAARHIVTAVKEGVPEDEKKFVQWFDSAQDRARQWFAMHARLVTICAACATAFVLQLDTLELLKTLSSSPDIRAKLVARASALESQADSISKAYADPQLHRQTMEKVRQDYPEANLPPALDTIRPGTTLAEAERTLATRLSGEAQAKEIEADYVNRMSADALAGEKKTLASLLEENRSNSLQFIPSPYPYPDISWNPRWSIRHPFDSAPWRSPSQWGWSWPRRRLVGILLSAALLSLGGPFWFNLLKQLSALRPSLATSIDDQPKQTKTGG